jgi:hypothetical protein
MAGYFRLGAGAEPRKAAAAAPRSRGYSSQAAPREELGGVDPRRDLPAGRLRLSELFFLVVAVLGLNLLLLDSLTTGTRLHLLDIELSYRRVEASLAWWSTRQVELLLRHEEKRGSGTVVRRGAGELEALQRRPAKFVRAVRHWGVAHCSSAARAALMISRSAANA